LVLAASCAGESPKGSVLEAESIPRRYGSIIFKNINMAKKVWEECQMHALTPELNLSRLKYDIDFSLMLLEKKSGLFGRLFRR